VINAGKPYTDASFTNSSALYWQDFNNGFVTNDMIKGIEWSRARSRNPNATLFGNTSTPIINNIHQGQENDCYYLSSISAIAEWPDRIKSAFLTQSYNNAGIFALKVFVRGKPTTIIVDDFLPFRGATGNDLIFDYVANKNEGLWAAILEKVWSKATGNYDVTNFGWTHEAVDFLTGAPSITYRNDDAATINKNGTTAWNIINTADASQQIMTAAVGPDGCDA
jgi:hypothetical protein